MGAYSTFKMTIHQSLVNGYVKGMSVTFITRATMSEKKDRKNERYVEEIHGSRIECLWVELGARSESWQPTDHNDIPR